MRVREHFLIGTKTATISVTARDDSDRQSLFVQALDAIVTRYKEEFGENAAKEVLESRSTELSNAQNNIEWRLQDEDSCWTEAKRQLTSGNEE